MYNDEATAELGAYVQYPAGVLFYVQRVRGLLREGADPNQIIAATGQTPLQALCIDNAPRRQSALEAFQHLLDAPGIDVNIRSSDGETLIHAVCKLYKSAEFLYALLRRRRSTLDIDINARDRFGRTALHYACERGRPIASVQYLVDAGADCNVLDENGITPLHKAINAFDAMLTPLLHFLLHRGRADPNLCSHPRVEGEETPYERALKVDLSYYAQLLFLNAGADDSAQLSSLITRKLMMMIEPAERTARIYKAKVTADLVEYVLEEDRREFSSDEIQYYIEDGANPNLITRGMPLVDIICRRFRGSEGLLALKYLLGLPNIRVDIADINGKILIHRLASMRKSIFLYILLKNDRNIQATINAEDDSGTTPLHFACLENVADNVMYLLAAGADCNAQDKDGYTPLYAALLDYDEYTTPSIVQSLLSHGANPNIPTRSEGTVLHMAVRSNLPVHFITILLDAGADPENIRDISGRSAKDLAEETRDAAVAIRRWGKARELQQRLAYGMIMHDRLGANSAWHSRLGEHEHSMILDQLHTCDSPQSPPLPPPP